MDWRKLGYLDWFVGAVLATGFVIYGALCIVRQEGVLFFPMHRIEQGSTNDGLNVYGEAAIRTGIAYFVWAVYCHFSGIWKAHPALHRETWGKISLGLLGAAVIATLWAMFAM